MFTGIIRSVSRVKNHRQEENSLFLEIETPKSWVLEEGMSVATNGVCLTVREIKENSYITELMKETVNKTGFKTRVPEFLNLEKSLSAGDSIDGHFVMGHIDSTGKVEEIKKDGRSRKITVSHPKEDSKFVVPRGSVAVDGVSLTVAEKLDSGFIINLVDYTLENTTLKFLKEGDLVNLEYDMLGKYVINNQPSTTHNQQH